MTDLDRIDRTILAAIQHDGRLLVAKLAECIVSCHNVSGTADYLLQIVVRDLDEYGTFTHDVLRTLPGVTAVESMLSLREIKCESGLPLA